MVKQDKNQLTKLKEQFSKGNNPNNGGGGKKPGNGPGRKFNFYWIYAIIFLIFIAIQVFGSMGATTENTNFQEFTSMVKDGDVEKVVVINEKEV